MANQDSERLTELAAQAVELATEYVALAEASGVELKALADRAHSNRRQIRRTRRLTWALVVALALTVGLAAAVGVVAVQVRRNEAASAANGRATAALAHRLDVAQTATRQKTLCPFYTLILDNALSPAARAAAKDKAAFDHAASVIRGGYRALGCATTFAP